MLVLEIFVHHLVIVFPLTVPSCYFCFNVLVVLLIGAIFIKDIHSSELHGLKIILIPRSLGDAIMCLHHLLWRDVVDYPVFEVLCVQN